MRKMTKEEAKQYVKEQLHCYMLMEHGIALKKGKNVSGILLPHAAVRTFLL